MARTNKYFIAGYVDLVDKMSIQPKTQRINFSAFKVLDDVPVSATPKYFTDNIVEDFCAEILAQFKGAIQRQQIVISTVNLIDFDHQAEVKQVTLTPNIN